MGYRNYATANGFIVDKAGNGDFTTIAAALTASVSGDTIFIRPGTYTENPTLVAGVNLTAFICDAYTPNVVINGNCTLTTAGTVTISGISLRTNSGNNVSVTGSAASVIVLVNCYLDILNNNGIVLSSSNANANILIYSCEGNIGTTGIKAFAHSGAGTLFMYRTDIRNSGASTTASTVSGAGELDMYYCRTFFPITTSSTSILDMKYVSIATNSQNVTAITAGGTSNNTKLAFCYISSGTASAVSISASSTCDMSYCWIQTTNTNAITGSGTLNYQALSFIQGSTTLINTSTQVGGLLQGGVSQAPSAGFIGEHISSAVTGVSLSNSTPTTITSISLTAGIWDLNLQFVAMNTGNNIVAAKAGFGTTTNTFQGNSGDAFLQIGASGAFCNAAPITLTNYRATLTATTTYYLIGQQNFGAGTGTGDGRISATRVA